MTILSLENLPRGRDAYLWADYVELLCLNDPDGLASRGDLLDRLREGSDLGADLELEVSAAVLGAWEGSEVVGGASVLASSVETDTHEVFVSDVFEHLAYRAATLGSNYPFSVTSRRSTLRRKLPRAAHRPYLFLLLASSLPRVQRSWYSTITRSFERMVAEALRKWLPKNAAVHLFGTSAPAGSRYRGPLFGKLARLATDLSEQLLVTEEDFRRRDAGDAGVDVVAWLRLGDDLSSRFIVLAQAACGLDWVGKQHQSGRDAWSQIIHFTAPHTNVIAIPYFFRGRDGEWARRRLIHGAVLIDRQRMLWLFRGSPPNSLWTPSRLC